MKEHLTDEKPTYQTDQRFHNEDGINIGGDGIGSAIKGYSLADLLSGVTSIDFGALSSGDTGNKDATLTVDPSNLFMAVLYGSMQKSIQRSIENVINKFPFGVNISEGGTALAIGSSYVLSCSTSNLTSYRTNNDLYSSSTYNDYYIKSAETSVAEYFHITNWSGDPLTDMVVVTVNNSAGTFANYTAGPLCVYANETIIRSFESSIVGYERDLYFRNSTHSNQWPKDTAEKNLLTEGTTFHSFESTEKNKADSIDGAFSNVFWRRLIMDPTKDFDTSGDDLKAFAELTGEFFDDIRQYVEHIRYAYTLGVRRFNTVAKEYISYLADNYGLDLMWAINNSDLAISVGKFTDHYADGYMGPLAKLSVDDIVYEYYRRILSNRGLILKKRGTRKVLEILANIVGVPEGLLLIREYIQKQYTSRKGGANAATISWDNNRIYTSTTNNLIGDRRIEIGYSPADAINKDYYTWGEENHSSFVDVAGTSFSGMSGTGLSQQEWELLLHQHTIPSDETRRTSQDYPILEGLHNYYIADSANKLTIKMFQAFMEYIESLYPELAKQVIPLSSIQLIGGKIYKNTIWHRPKLQYKEHAPQTRTFPDGRSDIELDPISINGRKSLDYSVNVAPIDISSVKRSDYKLSFGPANASSSVITVHVGTSDNIVGSEMILNTATTGGYLFSPTGHGGVASGISVPSMFESTSIGTTNFNEFNDNCVVAKRGKLININFTGVGSQWADGSTGIVNVNLYKMMDEDLSKSYVDRKYKLLEIIKEDANYGKYKLDNTDGLTKNMYVESSTGGIGLFGGKAFVVSVDSDRNVIETEPNFGFRNSKLCHGRTIGDSVTDVDLRGFSKEVFVNRIFIPFDWSSPIKTFTNEFSTGHSSPGGWVLSGDTVSGTVTISGVSDDTNAVLIDTEEYFWSYSVDKSMGVEYTAVTPSANVTDAVPYVKRLEDVSHLSGASYLGKYFMFIDSPNVPNILAGTPVDLNELSGNVFSVKFDGVGDGDRFRLEFIPAVKEPASEEDGETPGEDQSTAVFSDQFSKDADKWTAVIGDESNQLSFNTNAFYVNYGSKSVKIIPKPSTKTGTQQDLMLRKSLANYHTGQTNVRFYYNPHNHTRDIDWSGNSIVLCQVHTGITELRRKRVVSVESRYSANTQALDGYGWHIRATAFSGTGGTSVSTSWSPMNWSADSFTCVEVQHEIDNTSLYLDGTLIGTVACANDLQWRQLEFGLSGMSGGATPIDTGSTYLDSIVWDSSYIGPNNSNWAGEDIFTGGLASTGLTMVREFEQDEVGIKDDSYYYWKMVTLDPDTWYWWRLKNIRGKVNVFGNSIYGFSATEPRKVKTGSMTDQSHGSEELDDKPTREIPTGPFYYD